MAIAHEGTSYAPCLIIVGLLQALRRRPEGQGFPRVVSPGTPRAIEQGGGFLLLGRGDPLALQLLLEPQPRVLLVLGLVPEVEALAEAGVRPDEIEPIRLLVDQDLPLGQGLEG